MGHYLKLGRSASTELFLRSGGTLGKESLQGHAVFQSLKTEYFGVSAVCQQELTPFRCHFFSLIYFPNYKLLCLCGN